MFDWIKTKRIRKLLKAKKNLSLAETLAESSCKTVLLPWNGVMSPFKIREVNFMEIIGSGKYPNILFSFTKHLVKDKENTPETDVESLKKEQDSFMKELARKSMVEPTYQECFDAIVKRLPDYADGDDVIPADFLQGLYAWYLRAFTELLKKKTATLNGLGARRNTGTPDRPNTSPN